MGTPPPKWCLAEATLGIHKSSETICSKLRQIGHDLFGISIFSMSCQGKFQGISIVGLPFPYYFHTTLIRIPCGTVWEWYWKPVGRGSLLGAPWQDYKFCGDNLHIWHRDSSPECCPTFAIRCNFGATKPSVYITNTFFYDLILHALWLASNYLLHEAVLWGEGTAATSQLMYLPPSPEVSHATIAWCGTHRDNDNSKDNGASNAEV